MPNTKISALTAATSVTGAEVIPASLSGANVGIPLSLLTGAQSIATAGNTTTFTNATPLYTVFTGTQGQTVVLPDATTLSVGRKINIDNDSTQALQIKTNGGADLWTIAPGCDLYLTCLSVATAAGSWEKDYAAAKATTGLALTIDQTTSLSAKANSVHVTNHAAGGSDPFTAAQVSALPIADANSLFTTDTIGAALDQLRNEPQGRLIATSPAFSQNTNIVCTAVDATSNIFTAVGHGLNTDDNIYPMTNWTFIGYPLNVYPGGVSQQKYFAIRIDADTFQISATQGGGAVDITSVGDVTKWHWEKNNTQYGISMSLSGLSSKRLRVRFIGRALISTIGYLCPSGWYAADWLSSVLTNVTYPTIYFPAYFGVITADISSISAATLRYKSTGHDPSSSSSNANTQRLDNFCISTNASYVDATITSIIAAPTNCPIANGSYMEVYQL